MEQLQGTTKEKVSQFMQLLKDKSISKEQLTALIPLEVEFVKGLSSALKSEIEASKEKYSYCMKEFDRILDVLDRMCADDKITTEERHEIIDLIDRISDKMVEIEKNAIKEDTTIKKMLIVAMTILLIPVVVLAADK